MKICPAIDTVAVRAPAELAAALSVTEPLALPDAPLVTVETVVRGVQRRSGDAEEPERMSGEEARNFVLAASR